MEIKQSYWLDGERKKRCKNIYTVRRSELLTLAKGLNETKISELSEGMLKISTALV